MEYDEIDKLPQNDNSQIDNEQLRLLQTYFKNTNPTKLYYSVREIIIATILFIILSSSIFDCCLDYLPYMGSWLTKTIFKGMLFFTLFYLSTCIVKN